MQRALFSSISINIQKLLRYETRENLEYERDDGSLKLCHNGELFLQILFWFCYWEHIIHLGSEEFVLDW